MVILQGLLHIPFLEGWKKHHLYLELCCLYTGDMYIHRKLLSNGKVSLDFRFRRT